MAMASGADRIGNTRSQDVGDGNHAALSAAGVPEPGFVHQQRQAREHVSAKHAADGTLPPPSSVLKQGERNLGNHPGNQPQSTPRPGPRDGDDIKDPERLFPKMQIGQILNAKDGKRYMRLPSNSGGERQIVEDPEKKTWNETVLNKDGSQETISYKRGFSDHKSWDAKHNLRSEEVSQARTRDNQYNYTHKKEWDSNHALVENSTRYQDGSGKWHEDSTSNLTNGTRRHVVMDGDRTTTTDYHRDRSYDSTVSTRNVPIKDPVRSGPKTTATFDRYHYDPKTNKITHIE